MFVRVSNYSDGSVASRCDLQFKSRMIGLNLAVLKESMGFSFPDEVPIN